MIEVWSVDTHRRHYYGPSFALAIEVVDDLTWRGERSIVVLPGGRA